jgi:hypothetical protein
MGLNARETAVLSSSPSELPALSPPAGVTPDFHDPGGEHAFGYAIATLCITLTTISFLSRSYSRVLARKVHREDALLLLAYVRPIHGVS